MATYLLDADVLIAAKNTYYGFGFCPAFWHWLEIQNSHGKVFSINKVKDELLRDDEVSAWAKKQQKFFLPAAKTVHLPGALAEITSWVMKHGQYREDAKYRFLDGGADFYLVAYAMLNQYTLVTQERSAPYSKTVVKIPDVCGQFGVKCCNTFEMLNSEKARFTLPNSKSTLDSIEKQNSLEPPDLFDDFTETEPN